jgi:nicotinamidase-related amidase
MREILIVVDMQNDFVSGALGTKEAQAILPRVEEKVKTFPGKLVFTRDTHTPEYLTTQEGTMLPVAHCIRDTQGWHLAGELKTLAQGQDIIDKPSFGSLALADHIKALHQEEPISKITLIGLCTDICVLSNALILKAALPEIPVHVDAACCAGASPKGHETALQALIPCQVVVENF